MTALQRGPKETEAGPPAKCPKCTANSSHYTSSTVRPYRCPCERFNHCFNPAIPARGSRAVMSRTPEATRATPHDNRHPRCRGVPAPAGGPQFHPYRPRGDRAAVAAPAPPIAMAETARDGRCAVALPRARDRPRRTACACGSLGNDPFRVDEIGSRMLRYSWGVAPSEPQVRNRNPLR